MPMCVIPAISNALPTCWLVSTATGRVICAAGPRSSGSFHVIRDYGHRLHDDRHRLLAEVPQLLGAAQDLEAAVGPISPVLCHNDLLAANCPR